MRCLVMHGRVTDLFSGDGGGGGGIVGRGGFGIVVSGGDRQSGGGERDETVEISVFG